MPHSSGGGSHGGGFRGGGSGGGGARISRNSFLGARRYIYHSRIRHRDLIYYVSEDDFPERYIFKSILFIIVLLIFIIRIIGIFEIRLVFPNKLQNTNYDIAIDDELGILDDKAGLYDELLAFQEKTGITPVIYTVSEEKVKEYFTDHYLHFLGSALANYAYDYYTERYTDETHWVIVYALPENGVDWAWEGMQGDDTDDILNKHFLEGFNSELTEELERDQSVSAALIKTFQDNNRKLMRICVERGFIWDNGIWPIVLIIFIFEALMSFGAIISFRTWLILRHGKPEYTKPQNGASLLASDDTDNARVNVCSVCGCRKSSAGVCPNCGNK